MARSPIKHFPYLLHLSCAVAIIKTCLIGRDLGSLLVLTVDAAGTAVPGPEQEVPRPRGRLLRPRLLLPPVLLLHGLAQGKEAVWSLEERSDKRAFLMKYFARKCSVLELYGHNRQHIFIVNVPGMIHRNTSV